MPENNDKDFLEFLVKSIVDNPDDVKVEREVDERGVLISLSVNSEDMGMVIGRQGATAKAIRTLLRVVGAKNNARVNLKINEPEGSERPERTSAPAKEETKEETKEEPKEEAEKSIDDIVNDIK
jgi:uncharacterized protein